MVGRTPAQLVRRTSTYTWHRHDIQLKKTVLVWIMADSETGRDWYYWLS